ncbi:MAG: hypothetical protein ACKVK9_07530 [Nitrospinaceae bacterium]|nr:hypothetical protein [Nitrospinaceae bacterium]
MKFTGVRKSWHGVAGLIVLSAFLSLEFYTNLFEKSVGYYLKWENHKRPQLGRMWDRDRQSLVAQAKIKSIRSSLDLQEETALGISSFKHLFEGISPGFPLVVSREKFLQLYYDFPGQWSEQIISSYDLIDLDSKKIWDRVFLKRFGPWITIQFIDRQNIPIHELFLSVDTLFEVQATRTVKRGTLEDSRFTANRIFLISEFLPVLKSLDSITQKAVFPEPRWFLGKNYHVTRVGISDFSAGELAQHLLFGVEYDTEYYTGVLLIPVPIELADNMMSQIEKADLSDLVATPPSLGESP